MRRVEGVQAFQKIRNRPQKPEYLPKPTQVPITYLNAFFSRESSVAYHMAPNPYPHKYKKSNRHTHVYEEKHSRSAQQVIKLLLVKLPYKYSERNVEKTLITPYRATLIANKFCIFFVFNGQSSQTCRIMWLA